jgi:nucleoside-diphosphate-sugar epimerase
MSAAILVTGATGFVMANVIRHLAERGHDVVGVDLKPPDHSLRRFVEHLPGRVSFRQVDVTDRTAVAVLLQDVRPARAVHGAAITSIPIDVERARFVETSDVNVTGTLNVLAALVQVGVGRVVAISSGSVYGPRENLTPIREDDVKDPQAAYPMTKWAADMLARRFAGVHGLDLAVARLAGPFGPFERDTGSRPLLSPMAEWATAAVKGEPVVVSGDASVARDSVYVGDVARGVAAILFAERLAYDAYNVGWGRGTSAEQAIAALGRVVPKLRIEWCPERPSPWSGPGAVAGPLCGDRLRQDLGWEPRYDLDSGVAEYVEWLRRYL